MRFPCTAPVECRRDYPGKSRKRERIRLPRRFERSVRSRHLCRPCFSGECPRGLQPPCHGGALLFQERTHVFAILVAALLRQERKPYSGGGWHEASLEAARAEKPPRHAGVPRSHLRSADFVAAVVQRDRVRGRRVNEGRVRSAPRPASRRKTEALCRRCLTPP